MTSPGQAAGAAQQAAGQTASTAKDEAAATAQTAASAVSDVVGTATEQVGQVAGEAVDQIRQLTDQARSQAGEQVGNATQKLSDTVRSLANEVRDMSRGDADGSGTVAGLAQQLADRGEQLAEYLSSQGPGGLVQELRAFAARKPGTFLLGALATGVATGRVVKGAAAASSSGSTGAPTSTELAPATATFVAPVTPEPYPTSAPVVAEPVSPLAGGVSSVEPVVADDPLMPRTYGSSTGLR